MLETNLALPWAFFNAFAVFIYKLLKDGLCTFCLIDDISMPVIYDPNIEVMGF